MIVCTKFQQIIRVCSLNQNNLKASGKLLGGLVSYSWEADDTSAGSYTGMSSGEAAYSVAIPLTVCHWYPRKQRSYSKGRVGNPDKHMSRSGNSPNATPPFPHGCAHVSPKYSANLQYLYVSLLAKD